MVLADSVIQGIECEVQCKQSRKMSEVQAQKYGWLVQQEFYLHFINRINLLKQASLQRECVMR